MHGKEHNIVIFGHSSEDCKVFLCARRITHIITVIPESLSENWGRSVEKYESCLVTCVLSYQPIVIFRLSNCSRYAWTSEYNVMLFACLRKNPMGTWWDRQLYFIKLDNNRDDEFYCFARKPPKHVLYNSIYHDLV